jgi:hypothetical protein
MLDPDQYPDPHITNAAPKHWTVRLNPQEIIILNLLNKLLNLLVNNNFCYKIMYRYFTSNLASKTWGGKNMIEESNRTYGVT